MTFSRPLLQLPIGLRSRGRPPSEMELLQCPCGQFTREIARARTSRKSKKHCDQPWPGKMIRVVLDTNVLVSGMSFDATVTRRCPPDDPLRNPAGLRLCRSLDRIWSRLAPTSRDFRSAAIASIDEFLLYLRTRGDPRYLPLALVSRPRRTNQTTVFLSALGGRCRLPRHWQ